MIILEIKFTMYKTTITISHRIQNMSITMIRIRTSQTSGTIQVSGIKEGETDEKE